MRTAAAACAPGAAGARRLRARRSVVAHAQTSPAHAQETIAFDRSIAWVFSGVGRSFRCGEAVRVFGGVLGLFGVCGRGLCVLCEWLCGGAGARYV